MLFLAVSVLLTAGTEDRFCMLLVKELSLSEF